jgi:hypothetical protein
MKGEQIFLEAVELQSLADRIAYLDRACAGDPELRARVEGLIRAHEEAGTFLGGRLFDARPMVDHATMVEGPGTRIGPYTLLEPIGEGGMGIVFLAEQSQPVRRKVALTVIKPGMDTKQVIARFEGERQALALMDHPNIAKVLDAGATPPCEGVVSGGGRPYFVMELVRGIPITEYCNREQLSIPERLELFVLVCRAVQHVPSEGHHPPRHQALERPGDGDRRRRGAQGDRLRRGQGDGAEPHRSNADDWAAPLRGHAPVHEPGAGRALRG